MAQSVGASERNSVVVGSDPTQAKESFSSEYHIYIIFIYIYNIYIYIYIFNSFYFSNARTLFQDEVSLRLMLQF